MQDYHEENRRSDSYGEAETNSNKPNTVFHRKQTTKHQLDGSKLSEFRFIDDSNDSEMLLKAEKKGLYVDDADDTDLEGYDTSADDYERMLIADEQFFVASTLRTQKVKRRQVENLMMQNILVEMPNQFANFYGKSLSEFTNEAPVEGKIDSRALPAKEDHVENLKYEQKTGAVFRLTNKGFQLISKVYFSDV